jgi:hypothetical protein
MGAGGEIGLAFFGLGESQAKPFALAKRSVLTEDPSREDSGDPSGNTL